MARFRIGIEANALEGLAASLGLLDAATFGAAALTAVNAEAEGAYTRARARMIAGINLDDAYLQERMSFEPGTNVMRPEAIVRARGQLTNLRRYGAQQITKAVNWPNGSFVPGVMGKNPRKPGAQLPWKERTGDPSRGIPVNKKQAGISVEVTRGARKTISYAFTVAARGGNTLVVERVPGTKRKIRALYGPSVFQLFRAALSPEFLDDLAGRLASTTLTLGTDVLRNALL